MNKKLIGPRIKEIANEKNISSTEIADLFEFADIHQVYSLFSGRNGIPEQKIRRFCEKYDERYEYVAGIDDYRTEELKEFSISFANEEQFNYALKYIETLGYKIEKKPFWSCDTTEFLANFYYLNSFINVSDNELNELKEFHCNLLNEYDANTIKRNRRNTIEHTWNEARAHIVMRFYNNKINVSDFKNLIYEGSRGYISLTRIPPEISSNILEENGRYRIKPSKPLPFTDFEKDKDINIDINIVFVYEVTNKETGMVKTMDRYQLSKFLEVCNATTRTLIDTLLMK